MNMGMMTYACFKEAETIYFSLQLSLCIFEGQKFISLETEAGKKNQEDSKTLPQFQLKCGMQEPVGKETDRGIMH